MLLASSKRFHESHFIYIAGHTLIIAMILLNHNDNNDFDHYYYNEPQRAKKNLMETKPKNGKSRKSLYMVFGTKIRNQHCLYLGC